MYRIIKISISAALITKLWIENVEVYVYEVEYLVRKGVILQKYHGYLSDLTQCSPGWND